MVKQGKTWQYKIVLTLLFLGLAWLMIFAAEKHYERVSLIQELHDLKGRRYIRLREWRPNLVLGTKPAEHLNYYKNLEEKEYVLRTNDEGFIEPAFVFDKPDLNIFFLGGSTTECLYVDSSQRFPTLVGSRLQIATGKSINTINCGHSGSNTLHSINTLNNKVRPHQPDIVVMSHAINDLATLAHFGTYWDPDSYHNDRSAIVQLRVKDVSRFAPDSPIAKFLFNVAPYTYLGIVNKFDPPVAKDDEFKEIRWQQTNLDTNYLGIFKSNLEIFVSTTRNIGATPVLMTQSNNYTLGQQWVASDTFLQRQYLHPADKDFFTSFQNLYAAFNQTTRQVAQEQNVLLIDLDSLIPAGHEYIFDEVHYNTAGSQLAANYIYEALLPLIKPTTDTTQHEP